MNTIYDCENAKLNPNYQKQYRAAKKMVAIKPQHATSLYKNAMVNYKMYDELQYCPFSCINDMEKCIKLTDDISGKESLDRSGLYRAGPLMIATIFPMGTKYDCNLYYKRDQT